MIRRCDDRDFELIWTIINDGAQAFFLVCCHHSQHGRRHEVFTPERWRLLHSY
jgi:hypothetical protein